MFADPKKSRNLTSIKRLKEANRRYYAENVDLKKEKARRQKQKSEGYVAPRTWPRRISTMLRDARKRARKAKLPFALSSEHITHLLETSGYRCAITGKPLTLNPGQGPNKVNPWGPSIDQIKAGMGYTWDNVRVICIALNFALNQYADSVFDELAYIYLNPPECYV